MAAPSEAQAPPGAGRAAVELLSARELEALDRLRRQWLNKEIAADLHVSPETVKTHTANLYAKLGVGDRRRAVRRASAGPAGAPRARPGGAPRSPVDTYSPVSGMREGLDWGTMAPGMLQAERRVAMIAVAVVPW